MRLMGRGAARSVVRFAVLVSVLAVPMFVASPASAARSEFYGIVQGSSLDFQDMHGMRANGVRTVRFVINWGGVQPNNGTSFNWRPVDRLIGALASRGVRVVPTFWGNPTWVYGAPARPPLHSASDRQDWQDFLEATVARYGPGGVYWTNPSLYKAQYPVGQILPIQAWQIWNEPNLKKYFAPNPSVDQYVQLLRLSHDAIESRDPQARIVLAGMPGYGDTTAWNFLDGIYSTSPGIVRNFDAVALHPYARTLDQFRNEIEQIHAVMTNHGDQRTALWLTELAWGSAPPDRFGINKGPSGQAQLLSSAFDLILRQRSAWNVQRVFWFHWRDPRQARGCSFCGSAGLLDSNRDPKPAFGAFKGFAADSTAPQASVTSGPSEGGFTNDSTPSFSFASNEDGSTFQCRLDAGSFKICSSPDAAPSLSDGTHTFFVKAIDAPGNESTAVSRSFTVDTAPPTVTISSGPGNGSTSSDRSPSFSFSSNESGASFSCRLDGGGFQDCSSPFTASGLADASHTFEVRASDRAQNQSSTVSRSWVVDGAPQVSITAGPQNGGFTNDRTPSFSFSSLDSGSSFQCRMDGASFSPCTSPFTPSTLSDAQHSFRVKSVDGSNNESAVRSRTFTVDTVAPTVTIKRPRGATTTTRKRRARATFILHTSEHVSLRCRIDSRRFKPCSSHYRTPRLRPGTHRLKVKATDEAGNVGTKRKRFRIVRKRRTSVSVTAARAPSHPRCHGVAATLSGTPHGDVLRGTRGRDVIVGFAGNDQLDGRGGSDLICGRRGDDDLIAGWGDDRVLGGLGSDHIRGGAGGDTVRGGFGTDFCAGALRTRSVHCEEEGS